MDISLSLLPGHAAPDLGVVAPPPAPDPGLSPLPGILDAPKIVILGASIMEGAFGTGGTVHAHIAAWAAAMGITGTLASHASAGDNIANTAALVPGAKADHAASEGANLYIVHTGGNDVSENRPHPGGATGFAANYDALIAAVTDGGDAMIPLPLTFRHYSGTITPGVNEEDGSAPYNDQILLPRIAATAPDWMGPARPWIDPYAFALANTDLMDSDGIHGYGQAIAHMILGRLIARAQGRRESDSRAGQGLVFRCAPGDPQTHLPGVINKVASYPAGGSRSAGIGAVTDDGSAVDPFILIRQSPYTNSNAGGAGAEAYGRVADSRFHDPALLGNSIYVQGADVYTMGLRNLPPGDSVTLTAVASRNSGAADRKALLTLQGGEALVLDAATSAASNQVVFAPVTVPASGALDLTMAVDAGSTYGYLSGFALDFA